MKKFAKMSLVAAVAVAGLSTTASAQALEEAIKNVEVSGTMVFRYDDRNAEGGDLTSDSYKIAINTKSKVNDMVTANVRTIVGSGNGMATLRTANTASAGGDGEADVVVSNAYFGFTGIPNTTVNVGKQGLTTPFTVAVDAAGNEQNGSGILALSKLGPVTAAAAYFNNQNLDDSGDVNLGDGTENIYTVALMGNIGPVALDAWYLDMQNTFDVWTLGASAKFDLGAAKLSVGARHTELDQDNVATDDSLTKIDLGVKVGIFGASVGYGWTDKEGGIAALDNDAKSGYQGWALDLNNEADASLLKLNVNVDAMENLNVALNYNILDHDSNNAGNANDKDKEYYGQVTYKMSKNFMTYVRVGKIDREGDAEKGERGRIHVQYSF